MKSFRFKDVLGGWNGIRRQCLQGCWNQGWFHEADCGRGKPGVLFQKSSAWFSRNSRLPCRHGVLLKCRPTQGHESVAVDSPVVRGLRSRPVYEQGPYTRLRDTEVTSHCPMLSHEDCLGRGNGLDSIRPAAESRPSDRLTNVRLDDRLPTVDPGGEIA